MPRQTRLAPPFDHPDAADSELLLRTLLSREPEPGFAAEMAEQCEQLLARLPSDELRQIALRKLEGYTNEEIGGQINTALATVERRLRLIRKHWASDPTS
jgi:DNA-directed RNA polymerase specialized sigma24 family protein